MQFLIIAYDGKDAEAQQRRLAARTAHLERAAIAKTEGRLIAGGAILDAQERMIGSTLYMDFPSRQALDDWIAEDPYVTGNVWQSIEIQPIRLAL